MKRDLDLMREIMLDLEDRAHYKGSLKIYNSTPTDLELMRGVELSQEDACNASPEKYHNALLLHDAGFIKENYHFAGIRRTSNIEIYISRLTNSGHDFLDSIRDDGILSKVKTRLIDVGGGASLEVIGSLATSLIKQQLGID